MRRSWRIGRARVIGSALVKWVRGRDVNYGVLSADGNDGTEVYKLGIGRPHLFVKHITKS